MKKVALLYNKKNENTIRNSSNYKNFKFEIEAEYDGESTINALSHIISNSYIFVQIEIDREFLWIEKLLKEKPDIVFNICEGFWGPARECVFAAIMEQLHINYCGPDSTNLLVCHNKNLVRKLINSSDIIPEGFAVHNDSVIDTNKNLRNIKYPCIVKLNSEGSSIGLNNESVVYNYDELKKQVSRLYNKYKSNILIESYIEGVDVSVAFVEGIGALGCSKVVCDNMYDYNLKSINDIEVDIIPFKSKISEEIREMVNYLSKQMDIKGYAKFDFKVNGDKFYLIEINPQVSFHPNGEFMVSAYSAGYSYKEIVLHIIEYAIKLNKKPFSLGFI